MLLSLSSKRNWGAMTKPAVLPTSDRFHQALTQSSNPAMRGHRKAEHRLNVIPRRQRYSNHAYTSLYTKAQLIIIYFLFNPIFHLWELCCIDGFTTLAHIDRLGCGMLQRSPFAKFRS